MSSSPNPFVQPPVDMACSTCLAATCSNPFDLGLFSLETNVYYSPQLSILVMCPPGYTCQPGFQEYSVSLPAGTFAVPLPPIPSGSTTVGAAPLRLQCCETELSVPVPDGTTQAQLIALAQSMVATCAQQQAVCDAFLGPGGNVQPPYPTGFLNNQQCYQPLNCQPGFGPEAVGTVPSFISFNGNNACIMGGFIQNPNSQAQADAAAMSLLQSTVGPLILSGAVACVFPANIWNITWQTPTISTANGGTASGTETPSGFNIATSTPANNTAFGSFAVNGTTPYVGPSISANLQLTITTTGFSHGSGYTVNIIQDSTVLITVGYSDQVTGTFVVNLPMTLNATSGSVITVQYTQISSGGISGGSATAVTIIGVFTSTPP